MDSEKLADLIDHILENELDIHSVTIIRNGYIVADAAIYPFDAGSKHNLKSVTKSFVSALIGIAIDQGYIEGVDQTVLSLFPDRAVANVDADKQAMTLENLLMMATGLECRDSARFDYAGALRMMQSDDWVQYVLDLPMLEQPGTRFEYCNGASLLLSAIVQEQSGLTAAEFAEQHLFAPLGIDDVIWPSTPQGVTIGYADLHLQPHDMAKFGYLYLQNGQWAGDQIVPADYVAASIANTLPASGDSYGYQWWVADDGLYSAQGHGGQFILVVPESELAVVFTANLSEDDAFIPPILMDIFVRPSVVSAAALPPNPGGLERLESRIQAAAQPPADPQPVPPLPEIAQRVSGNTYLLDMPNPTGFSSLTFTFGEGAEASMSIGYPPGTTSLPGTDSPLDEVMLSLGLDDVYRFTTNELGLKTGAKGEWLDEDTFLVQLDMIGSVGLARLHITFQDEEITVELWDDLMSPAMLAPAFGGRVAE
jgi:CubicO group peptidase (beta-lactamase class C family)